MGKLCFKSGFASDIPKSVTSRVSTASPGTAALIKQSRSPLKQQFGCLLPIAAPWLTPACFNSRKITRGAYLTDGQLLGSRVATTGSAEREPEYTGGGNNLHKIVHTPAFNHLGIAKPKRYLVHKTPGQIIVGARHRQPRTPESTPKRRSNWKSIGVRSAPKISYGHDPQPFDCEANQASVSSFTFRVARCVRMNGMLKRVQLRII